MLFLKHPRQLVRIIRQLYQARWIYIHFLAYDPTLAFWCVNRKLLRRSTWIVWGDDVYAYQKELRSIKTRIYERLRRRIIPVFTEVAAFVPEDFDVLASVYGSHAEYVPVLYPLPVNLSHLENIEIRPQNQELVVMIGNSGDPTNNHDEMLDILAPYRNEKMKVVCPLAYGGTVEYKQKLISRGISLFGDKFVPWLEMKEKQVYAEALATVDIALMNHKRQQGLGNILALMYLGKKVFLRTTTTSYSFLMRNNCTVFGLETIKEMDFATFREPVPDYIKTRNNIGRIIGKEYVAGLWKDLIKRHLV